MSQALDDLFEQDGSPNKMCSPREEERWPADELGRLPNALKVCYSSSSNVISSSNLLNFFAEIRVTAALEILSGVFPSLMSVAMKIRDPSRLERR